MCVPVAFVAQYTLAVGKFAAWMLVSVDINVLRIPGDSVSSVMASGEQ